MNEPQDPEVINSIIHLKSWQKKRFKFHHPLLDTCRPIPEDTVPSLVGKVLAGDKEARQELIMGHLILVKWLVGRYLYHWRETRRFQDDICSEGVAAVVEYVDQITADRKDDFRAVLVVKIKFAIEVYLNDMRTLVSASRATNFRRLKDGELPEYHYHTQLEGHSASEDGAAEYSNREASTYDDTPEYIDLLDSLERLKEIDSEEMVDMVLLVLEQQHQLLEEDLTERERELIHRLSSIGAYCG